MWASRSIQRIVWCSIVAAMGALGCEKDNPPPSAPAPRAAEGVAAKAAAPTPVETNAAAAAPPPADPPEKPSAPPEDRSLRYGAKIYALPSGCGPAGEKFSCNPLTNAGCHPADGEVCDDDDKEGFACDPDSDNVQEGGECNDKDGPSCAAGMTCDNPSDSEPRGICRKFCCTKGDCPARTKCVALDREFGTLGVCK
jgi:hypothetical protein